MAVTRAVQKTESEWSIVLSTIELRKAQEADQDLKTLIELGERPSSKEVESLTPRVRHYWLHWDMLQLRDGVVHRKHWPALANSCSQVITRSSDEAYAQ